MADEGERNDHQLNHSTKLVNMYFSICIFGFDTCRHVTLSGAAKR